MLHAPQWGFMTTNSMGLTHEQSANCFSDDELEGMINGDAPLSNAWRELLAYRRAGSKPVAFINGAWTLVYYRPPKEMGLKIADKLYAAPPLAVTVPDGWIKFSEQAPPLRTPLLVCSGNGVVQLTLYGFDGEHWQDWYEEFDPIKVDRFDWWQLLPTEPKR